MHFCYKKIQIFDLMHILNIFLWIFIYFFYFFCYNDIVFNKILLKIILFLSMTKSKNLFNFLKSEKLNALLLIRYIWIYVCLLFIFLLNILFILYFLNIYNFVWFFVIVHTSLVQYKCLDWLRNVPIRNFGVLYLYPFCNMIQAIQKNYTRNESISNSKRIY